MSSLRHTFSIVHLAAESNVLVAVARRGGDNYRKLIAPLWRLTSSCTSAELLHRKPSGIPALTDAVLAAAAAIARKSAAAAREDSVHDRVFHAADWAPVGACLARFDIAKVVPWAARPHLRLGDRAHAALI